MSDLLALSLIELTDALRTKVASPVDLMREVFLAVDRHNPALCAIVAERDRDQLLHEARSAEQRIARGEGRALEGIPLGVKDLENAAGLPTTHGSRALRGNLARRDSVQVARLRAAGAIVFGKTNIPEFALSGLNKNLLFGATASPWDLTRSSGGSSGGSAAALAGGLLPLVTASDGGGSIRIPGSFVGAVGLKPSFGRIPYGSPTHWDHSASVVCGPISKTVGDAAFFLDLTAGYDASDPTSLPAPGLSYRALVEQPLARSLRIAYSNDLGYAVVQSDVAACVERAARVLSGLGHKLVPLHSPPPDVSRAWHALTGYESGARFGDLLAGHEQELGRATVETWRSTDPMSQRDWGDFAAQRARLVAWCAQLFADCDVLLTPTVPFDPPPRKGPLPSATEGRTQPFASIASLTLPFNLSWHPALTLRAGMSDAGLPVGMQLVAAHHREDLLLQLGRAFEREVPAHPSWPRMA
jgi:aspartyl-tRNA(Asn)/glutamyl-tRNA(Gln) amidotransferase subunit A